MRQPAQALAALALALPAGAQTTWYVDVNGTPPGNGSQANPYTSLQACFGRAATVDGDTVLVLPGTYVEDLDLLGKSLDVQSTAGAAMTTLQAATATSVLRVVNVAEARLEGFTLRDGRGTSFMGNTYGGGVVCSNSTLELVGCVLLENHAARGAGVCALNGTNLTLSGCTLQDGEALQGGGLYASGGDVLMTDTRIVGSGGSPSGPGNSLPRQGGGICARDGATLSMFDCEVSGCLLVQNYEGGGLYLAGGMTHMEDCLIESNGGTDFTTPSYGGGIRSHGPLDLIRCTIRNNRCLHEGGGLLASATLVDCEIIGNQANGGGGARGNSSFTDCLIQGNSAISAEGNCSNWGGGVWGGTLVGCRLEGNSSTRRGGGAYDATLIGCEVVGNTATAGAICNEVQGGAGISNSNATDCLFEDNVLTAYGPGSPTPATGGGAAYGSTLTGCTLRGNRVVVPQSSGNSSFGAYGGGAWGGALNDCLLEGNEVVGPMGLSAQGGGLHGGSAEGCTFRGNRVDAVNAGYQATAGGGAASSTLSRCQLFDNEADHGGGAWKCSLARCSVSGNLAHLEGGALSVHPGGGNGSWGASTVSDSICWGNAPDELNAGMGSIAATYSDVLGGYPGVGNIAADPLFWNELQGDLHLRAGSPCIDAGDPNAPLDPDGSRRDMGALPYDASYVGGPYIYCEAKETSQACFPAIGSTGSPTVTGPDDFVVGASQLVQNQNGILFWGLAPDEAPFMGGLRCVANPVVRTPVSNSGGAGACGGTLSFAFTQSYFATQGLVAGDRLFAQFWFRDPQQPDGTGVGLSDAIDFTILP